jgi:hypothetical protein
MPHVLLKNLLSESPDDPLQNIPDKVIDRMRSLGYFQDGTKKPRSVGDRDVVTFIIDASTNTVVYNLVDEVDMTKFTKMYAWHSSLQKFVQGFQEKTPSHQDQHLVGPNSNGDYGISWAPYPVNSSVPASGWKGVAWFLDINTKEEVKQLANSLNWENYNYRSDYGPAGRFWPESCFMSFWGSREKAVKQLTQISKLMKRFNVSPEKCVFEFVDVKDLFTFADLSGKPNSQSEKVSDAEIADLMKKQHLDPAAKKKLGFLQRVMQKKSPGFEFQAQRNANMPAIAESDETSSKVKWDVKGIGGVPNQQEINYRGFIVNMTAEEFRKLVPPGNSGPNTITFVKDKISKGEPIAPPFLNVKWIPEKKYWQVLNHEGRSRSDAISRNVSIPVYIFPSQMRARDLTDEMKKAPFVKQKHLNEDVPEDFGGKFIVPNDSIDSTMPSLKELAGLMLKESPDGWRDEHSSARWDSPDARTFLTFPDFELLAEGTVITHLQLIHKLEDFRKSGEQSDLYNNDVLCSNSDALNIDLTSGVLADYLDRGEYDYDNDEGPYDSSPTAIRAHERERSPHRNLDDSLAGRLWFEEKVISFWNDQHKVLKLWSQIQSMFRNFSDELGNLEEYRIDWIEREDDESQEMTSASSVKSSGGAASIEKKPEPVSNSQHPETEENGQLNFIAKIFQEPAKLKSLSPEKLKMIQQKMHVLEPEAKNALMKMTHKFRNKAAEIADILGMTVAQFNHLTQVAETK